MDTIQIRLLIIQFDSSCLIHYQESVSIETKKIMWTPSISIWKLVTEFYLSDSKLVTNPDI